MNKKKVIIKVRTVNKGLPKWDLSVAFYKGLDDPQIQIDKECMKMLSDELALYRGEIKKLQPWELSIMLRKYETLIALARKLSNFAFLYADTHRTDEEAANFQSTISEKIHKYFELLGFIYFELNELPKISEYKVLEFLNHPRLQRYLPWLTHIFNSYSNLNEAMTFIIDKKSIVSSAWDRLYAETCAGLKFSFNGKSLNEAEIRAKANDDDPEVRKKATEEMNRVFKNNAKVITMCYNMLLKDKSVDDELWGMEEPVAESLNHNRIEKEDLLAMAGEVVDSYIPISQRFYGLLAKLVNKPVLDYEDRNIDPIKSEAKPKKVTWAECEEKVLQAYSDFSLEYVTEAMDILSQPIVDAAPAKGKRSGAYCIQGRTPYILLNFTGTEDDVRTFAHELGHAVHHVLSEDVGVLNNSTPTCLAEIASEFAEYLVFKKQLEAAETDDKEKLRLLIGRVQDMIQSIHRQVAFYKFEERAHRERKKGELSTKRLNQIWREETQRYLGFDIGERCQYLWMEVSHLFNSPYYVYSYAFAGLVVNNLIYAYEHWEEASEFEKREDFSDLYLDMLSNTGVEDFVSLLEPFGLDALAPDFWANGLKTITKYIDEIERLAKKLNLL